MRANNADLLKLARAGYRVERWGDHGWLLRDPEGEPLQVAGHGGVAPTQWEAVAEGLHRLELEACEQQQIVGGQPGVSDDEHGDRECVPHA